MKHSLQRSLCPKEVAGILGISERSAARLMSRDDIASFRAGSKLLRTTAEDVEIYRRRSRPLLRERPAA